MIFSIPKGGHYARPRIYVWKWKPQRFQFNVGFLDAAYHLQEQGQTDVDQYDWNKLLGLSFNLFTNHKDSFMLGWRYNLDTKRIELGKYQHRNGERFFEGPFGNVSPKGGRVWGTAHLQYEQKRVDIAVNWESHKVEKIATTPANRHKLIYEFDRMPVITREINLYFGGNEPAPRRLHFLKETGYR